MAKKEEGPKVELERQYTIPLRKEFSKAPRYKRTNKAVKAIRQFLEKHVKSDNVKIGKYLNTEVWKHGIKNPPPRIKVNVKKYSDGKAMAELVGAPEKVEPKEAKKAKKPVPKEEVKKAEIKEEVKKSVEEIKEKTKEVMKEKAEEIAKQIEQKPEEKKVPAEAPKEVAQPEKPAPEKKVEVHKES